MVSCKLPPDQFPSGFFSRYVNFHPIISINSPTSNAEIILYYFILLSRVRKCHISRHFPFSSD